MTWGWCLAWGPMRSGKAVNANGQNLKPRVIKMQKGKKVDHLKRRSHIFVQGFVLFLLPQFPLILAT